MEVCQQTVLSAEIPASDRSFLQRTSSSMQLIQHSRIKELRERTSHMVSLEDEACGSSQASLAMGENKAFVNASFEGWASYPTNLDTYDPMIADGECYSSHLRELSPTLFCNLPSSTRVDVIDVYGEKHQDETSLRLLKLTHSRHWSEHRGEEQQQIVQQREDIRNTYKPMATDELHKSHVRHALTYFRIPIETYRE